MKQYKFQYNKTRETLAVVSLCIVAVFFSMVLEIYLGLNSLLAIAISIGVAFLMFRQLKGKAVGICTAQLGETSLTFEFENNARTIQFADLISYKAYYGKNGPVLYLKNNIDNFKIFVNSHYCKTEDFKLFCKDSIIQLDKYKGEKTTLK